MCIINSLMHWHISVFSPNGEVSYHIPSVAMMRDPTVAE
jgi:hypothetical protein